jgi:hypothetical protein
MKATIAKALRGLADKLAREPEKIIEVPKPEESSDDMNWAVPGPPVRLTAAAEEMLAEARRQTPKDKREPEGPAEGSAWYRYLMASARRENGQ